MGANLFLGVIDIGAVATTLAVVELDGGAARTVTERRHELRPGPGSADLLSSLILSESETARDLGVEDLAVIADGGLRGTREARLIDRSCRALGLGPLRILSGRQKAEYAFLGATAGREDELPAEVAVAHVDREATGVAIGSPGERPGWIASRPAGPALLARRARFGDPPGFEQLAAAANAAERLLGSLAPPEHDGTLVTVAAELGPHHPGAELVCQSLARVLEPVLERGPARLREGEAITRAGELDLAGETA